MYYLGKETESLICTVIEDLPIYEVTMEICRISCLDCPNEYIKGLVSIFFPSSLLFFLSIYTTITYFPFFFAVAAVIYYIMGPKRNSSSSSTTPNSVQSQYEALEEIQQHLDDLQTDRASMEIVYTSLKNAFLIYPSAEWDEIDKEICRAYDDLMAQVRQLDRSLKKLDKSIKSTITQNPNNNTSTLTWHQEGTLY